MIASTYPQAPSREMETFKKRKGQFIYAPLDGGVQKRRPLKKIGKCQFDVCHITPNQSQTYQKKSQFLLTQNALPTAAPACPTPVCLILRVGLHFVEFDFSVAKFAFQWPQDHRLSRNLSRADVGTWNCVWRR
jgi:hypothetical protein